MAKVHVKFFGPIKDMTGGETESTVTANTVREVLRQLAANYGDSFKTRILDESGSPQAFVNIFVNNKDIRYLKESETALNDGDEILILPAVAGGSISLRGSVPRNLTFSIPPVPWSEAK